MARQDEATQDKGCFMQTERAIPELSIDTQTIENMLAEAQIGDIVTYEAMSAAIGRDTQREARGNVTTARHRLHQSRQMVFGAVTNVGLKRLDDTGKIAAAQGHTRRGRSQYRRAIRTVSAVDNFDALPNDQKLRHSLIAAQSGVILSLTAPSRTRRLEAAIGENVQKAFKPKECLALMKGTI
jgi:hypothetical protein